MNALSPSRRRKHGSVSHTNMKIESEFFCTDSLHGFFFLQREKRLGRGEDQNFEDRRTPSRVSSLKRKPSDLKLLSPRDLVPRVGSGRRDRNSESPAASQKRTATLSSSFSSSRKSETDEDSSSSTSPPSSPTMRSNAGRIIQADLSQSAPLKSRSLPTPPKPPLPPKPTLPSKEIPSQDRDPSFSPTVKPRTRRRFQSDETPSSPLELSIKSTSEETHQTSPPSFPEATSPSKEVPQEDLHTRSRPIVKPRSRRSFQSDETLTSPLELPVKSTFEEPHQTSPPHSAKTPSSPKPLLLSDVADEVDGRPRSKPPLAPKPKLISSEVTPSHQPKKTPAPRLSPPVTRRFPAPTEPPPPPPEKPAPPESSPLATGKDLLDLEGSDSNSPPTAQLISVTEDDSASVHAAPATQVLRPSSPQLGSLDVLQKEEGSGLCSSKQEVETKHPKTSSKTSFSMTKTP